MATTRDWLLRQTSWLTVTHLEERCVPSVLGDQSASAGIIHLNSVMDEFHDRVPVYEDVSSPGNRFHAWSKIPDGQAMVEINGSSTDNPHSGATAIRASFQANTAGNNFGGFYFLNGVLNPNDKAPMQNFGVVPNAGVDLTGATTLTFWVRGEQGGEQIEFFMGGVGRDPTTGIPTMPHPGSTPVVRTPLITLSSDWQQIRLDVSGKDLSYVLGGFGWIASATGNPSGAIFHIDDIDYELNAPAQNERLSEPRFLRSFTTLDVQPDPNDGNTADDFDLVLRNTAFAYDNALALLSYIADGSPDSVRRARLLGDAFVYAINNDRTFTDGRVRTAYAAGDIALPPGWVPNGKAFTAPVPGFFQDANQIFTEVEQSNSDTGNNAWTMIALLSLHHLTGDAVYLDTARGIGEFIRTFRNDTGQFQGFQGGLEDPESANPIRRPWASTEHNLDVFAAFSIMARVTGEAQWQADADHARAFVEAMWDSDRNCFLAGTTNPNTRNTAPGQLPVDVQAWSVLAIPDLLNSFPEILRCAELNHLTQHDGFTGFDFNEDKDVVWFEGTAQMAAAYTQTGETNEAEVYLQELRRAQATAPFGDGGGIVAASHDLGTTGFGFDLYRRLHIGATAWNIFAQSEFNPFADPTGDVGQEHTNFVALGNGNGPLVFILDSNTGNQITTLMPFASAPGGVRTATADVTGDGRPDYILGTGPGVSAVVVVIDGATLQQIAAIQPFEPTFTGGVFVTADDINGDGKADIGISADMGGGPRLRIFSGALGDQIADFLAIADPNFRGGLRAAFADFDGEGNADIIAAAGFMGGPRVALYNGAAVAGGNTSESAKFLEDFFVFEQSLRNGAFPAAGDITGDGKADLLAGGGPDGAPRVFGLSGADLVNGTQTQIANFFAFDMSSRSGVRLTIKDANSDLRKEIVAGTGAGVDSQAIVFDGSTIPINGRPDVLGVLDPFGADVSGIFVG